MAKLDKIDVVEIAFSFIGVFILGILISLLFAWVTQIAWQYSVGEIFHLPNLTFWQAFWLNMFGNTVVRSSSSSSKK